MTDQPLKYRPFPKLSKEFVAERIQVGWKDLVWAASNHWLGKKALAELADGIPGTSDDTRVAVALAAMDDDDAALRAVLDQQAQRESVGGELIRERWMRIAAAWLYQHRELFDDPLAVIEEIWVAFGHPPAMNGLIRWMPVPEGGKPGELGLLERWRDFANVP